MRGPRQVGKSSWLKHLLQSHSSPTRAFYLSCEGIEDHKELAALLVSLRGKRDFVLLDEITFVREWWRAIKHELDSGFQGTLVVTGSHAADLRHGADRMPGRFGGGDELELLPMSFAEFCAMRAQAGWPMLSHVEAVRAFMRSGGFPAAVVEAGPEGREPVQTRETFRRWLLGDAMKLGKQELFLRDIMGQLAVTMGSCLSLQKLAQRTQLGSHHTAQDYVALLEDCFALRTLFSMDPNTGAFHYRREKKFYFTDPLIFSLALNWAGFPVPASSEDMLAEAIAHETLVRAAKGRSERIGYFSSAKGEVDFFGFSGWALEVKWSERTHNLSKAFKSMVCPEKLVWNQLNFLESLPSTLR
jgi:uncharacterized protein